MSECEKWLTGLYFVGLVFLGHGLGALSLVVGAGTLTYAIIVTLIVCLTND